MFDSKLLPTRRAAEALGVKRRDFHRLVERGVIKPAAVLDAFGKHGAFFFDPADIEALKRSGEADKRTGAKQ